MECCTSLADPAAAVSLAAALVMGLAGSAHCLGMCGPLVAAADGLRLARWTPWAPLPMHAGRLVTYGAMGLAAGLIGGTIERGALAVGLQGVAATLGGLALIFFGLVLLGWMPFRWGLDIGERATARLAASIASQRPASGLLMGLYWGFLPCGLVWAALVNAGATASPLMGSLVMLLFGLGTVPALLVLGGLAGYIGARYRRWLTRLAAATVVAMGLLLLLRTAASAGWIAHLKLAAGVPLF